MSRIGQIESSSRPVLVTPHDTNKILDNNKTKGILLGGAGTLAVIDDHGNAVTITGLAAGVIHPIATNVIKSTGTSATNICAFF